MEEKSLILAVKNDDPDAFRKLFQRYSAKLYYFAFRFLRNQTESEEVVQEVFVKIWNIRKQLNENLSFNSFLFTIAKNHIFNLRRNKINHEAFLEFLAPFYSEAEEFAEENIITSDLQEHLQHAIDNLPPQRRLIFKKSREEGLTYPQIASLLHISEKTVETQIRLALKTLKNNIE